MTFVLGLTGSIGMGKSTTSQLFRDKGIPVYDADATVHALYRGKAAPLVEAAFPGSVVNGVVDRKRLSDKVLSDVDAIKRLEAIIHPLVREAEQAFLRDALARSVSLVVLDIPLLLETSGQDRVDAVLLVSTDYSVQKARVLARPGMTEEHFKAILARQMPDSEKRKRAHLVIDTGMGEDDARRQVDAVIRTFSGRNGHAAKFAVKGNA
jgi:dephospho-CoA kinase